MRLRSAASIARCAGVSAGASEIFRSLGSSTKEQIAMMSSRLSWVVMISAVRPPSSGATETRPISPSSSTSALMSRWATCGSSIL